MNIEYPIPSGPALIMGYDWERYGKHSDPKKNEEEQGWSWTGVNAIMSVHRKYDAPLTFFVLTKVLDVPHLRDLVLKTAPDKLVEISQHSHSHYLVRPLAPVKDQPVSLAEYIGDVSLAQDKLVDLIGQSPKGFRAPLGYYKGFKESEDVIRGLTRFNFCYISSDARNSKDEFPAPWQDSEGRYRQPYIYEPYNLVEIPIQGWSDNVLKGMSRHTPLPDAGLEKEIEHNRENLNYAIEHGLMYAPAYHPWSIGAKDPEANAIDWLLNECRRKSVPVLSYGQAANLILQKTERQ